MSLRFLSLPIDEVSTRLIRPSGSPLRDTLGDIEELSVSIQRIGLLQPIIVRGNNGKFEVVAGNRRFEACRRLRWRTVPCHIVELSDKEAYELALTENIQRRTLDPFEEARALQTYVEKSGWGGITELSEKIGKSPAYISKRIRLLEMPSDIVGKIFRRQNNVSVIEELLALETSEQLEVARALEERPLSVLQVRKLVETIKQARGMKGRQQRHQQQQSASRSLRPSWEAKSARHQLMVGCIDQTIAALRLALSRLDNVIGKIEKEWVEKEILTQYRFSLHSEIDSLVRLKKKLIARSRES